MEKEPFESIEEETFNNQPIIEKSDQNLINSVNTNDTQFQEYPSKRLINDKPKKSKLHIASLIVTIFIIFLIISTFFLSWYTIGMSISLFFFGPVSLDVDMNFHLTEISVDGGPSMNATDMSTSISYSEFEKKAIEQDKPEALNLIDLFRNLTILVIILLIFSIITFIGILGFIQSFGNKKMMKKIVLIFSILTFLSSTITAGYFIYEWDSNIFNNKLPNLNDDSSSDSSFNIFETEEANRKLNNIGFWDTISLGFGADDLNNSNMSFYSTGGASSSDLFKYNFSFSPGLSWYFMILISILSLFSIVLLLNKNLKIMLMLLFVCSIILFGIIFYLSLNANAEETSYPSFSSWDYTSDPAEVSRFIGTWELDINNTTGYKEDENLTKETWFFWQEDTHDMHEISYITENQGSGRYSTSFYAKNNRLSISGGTYYYIFEDNDTKLTLTKDNEKLVLNKNIG